MPAILRRYGKFHPFGHTNRPLLKRKPMPSGSQTPFLRADLSVS
jgi:hypothetical protein